MTGYKQIVGRFGEELASNYLKRKGYKVLDRNIKNSYQEIDIIAKIKDLTVFVEVKTRTSDIMGKGEEGMDQRKINNLNIALKKYCEKIKIDVEKTRLDLIVVEINKRGLNNY